jgi:hypothetical protein
MSSWAARWAVRALAGPWRERKGREGNRQAAGERLGQARNREGEGISFSKLFLQLLLKPFEKNLQNQFEKKELHSTKYVQQHECTYMFLDLIVDFISIKIIFLLFLSTHIKYLNQLAYLESEIFRVLQRPKSLNGYEHVTSLKE